jgi:hypothetical protein
MVRSRFRTISLCLARIQLRSLVPHGCLHASQFMDQPTLLVSTSCSHSHLVHFIIVLLMVVSLARIRTLSSFFLFFLTSLIDLLFLYHPTPYPLPTTVILL